MQLAGGGLRRLPTGRPLAQEQELEAAACGPAEEGACRQHARVVAHQQVAGPQQRGQVGEVTVLDALPTGRRAAIADQQAGGVARLGRMLGDQLGRQLVVQLFKPHARPAFLRGGRQASHLLATQPQ